MLFNLKNTLSLGLFKSIKNDPVYRLLINTARNQSNLIILSLCSNLLGALCEALTLGALFLAIEILSSDELVLFDWGRIPLVGLLPSLSAWLNGIPFATQFICLMLIAGVMQGFNCFLKYINLLSVDYFSARCLTIVTDVVNKQILNLSFPCVTRYKVGALLTYVLTGPNSVSTVIKICSTFASDLILILVYLMVLMTISPWLLIAVVFICGFVGIIQKYLLPKISSGSKSLTRANVEINNLLTENFQGLRLLHTSGQLDVENKKMNYYLKGRESQLRYQSRRINLSGPLNSFLPIFTVVIISIFGVIFLGDRRIDFLASLIVFVLSLQRLNARINSIANNLNQFADNFGKLDLLRQILSDENKQYRRKDGKTFSFLQESIQFKQVCLRYLPESPPSLSEISFTLVKGQTLALVGPSGAGKSSIADLIVGLFDPSSGCILIDNVPLDCYHLGSWQNRLGVVSQDTFLFNASIADNVAYGSIGKSQESIVAACKAAQASEFIEALPDQYKTVVGERGYRLSGGQRQRLSLARAILREPDLLILDEATSALDSQNERLVQEAIERFENNHTVIVIAHRLSTIVKADNILVLDEGRLVEHGTHSSLLERDGIYRQLWLHQIT